MTLFEEMLKEYEYNTKECFSFDDYTLIFKSFGNILLQTKIGTYSGDYIILYNENNKYQLLISGYGSCSGCDSLLACNNENDFNMLVNNIKESIKEFNSIKELVEYLENKDIIQWYKSEDEFIYFLNQVKKIKQNNKDV